jgi:hypothetical protein
MKRIITVGLLLATWAVLLAFTPALLAPATGAATVSQLNAGDAGYLLAMSAISIWAVAGWLVSAVAVIAVVRVLRSKQQ